MPGWNVKERPLWRRCAGRVRLLSRRLLTPVDRIFRRNQTDLLPPAHLRIFYYSTWDPAVFFRMCQSGRAELLSHGLQPHHRLLDIGSGIGNVAIGLMDFMTVGYDGIDINPEAVAWCNSAIPPKNRLFRFHFADLTNGAYNPSGRQPSSTYRFPFADASFDVIYLASVFTHMHPDDVRHYLLEIKRLLAPEGFCVASAFLLTAESRAAIDHGKSFMSFPCASSSDEYRVHDATRPEAAVAVDEQLLRRDFETAVIVIRRIGRGSWWSGIAHDQDVIISELPKDLREPAR